MIGFLRRLLRREKLARRAALLNDRLMLTTESPQGGKTLTEGRFRRRRGFVVERAEPGPAEVVPLELLLDELSERLSEDQREELLDAVLATCLPHLAGPGGLALAESMKLTRDRLRRRLPAPPPGLEAPYRLTVDMLLV